MPKVANPPPAGAIVTYSNGNTFLSVEGGKKYVVLTDEAGDTGKFGAVEVVSALTWSPGYKIVCILPKDRNFWRALREKIS